jgi:hypothetical protein
LCSAWGRVISANSPGEKQNCRLSERGIRVRASLRSFSFFHESVVADRIHSWMIWNESANSSNQSHQVKRTERFLSGLFLSPPHLCVNISRSRPQRLNLTQWGDEKDKKLSIVCELRWTKACEKEEIDNQWKWGKRGAGKIRGARQVMAWNDHTFGATGESRTPGLEREK